MYVMLSRPTWCVSVDTWGHPQREQISTGCPTSTMQEARCMALAVARSPHPPSDRFADLDVPRRTPTSDATRATRTASVTSDPIALRRLSSSASFILQAPFRVSRPIRTRARTGDSKGRALGSRGPLWKARNAIGRALSPNNRITISLWPLPSPASLHWVRHLRTTKPSERSSCSQRRGSQEPAAWSGGAPAPA